MNGIGERLRQRRQELGLSIEQAAEATKFRPDLIRAVEDGRAGLFSANAHRNGFIRTYAKFLGLDGDDIVRSQKTEEERAQEALRGIGPGPTGPPRLRRVAVVLIAVAVVAVIASVVINLVGRDRPASEGERGPAEPTARVETADRSGRRNEAAQPAGGEAAGRTAGARGAGVAPEMDYIPGSAPVGSLAGGGIGEPGGPGVAVGGSTQAGGTLGGEGAATAPLASGEVVAVADSARARALEVVAERHSVFLILANGGQPVYDGWIYRGVRKVFRGSGEFVIVSLSSTDGVTVMIDGHRVALPESQAEDKALADWPVPSLP